MHIDVNFAKFLNFLMLIILFFKSMPNTLSFSGKQRNNSNTNYVNTFVKKTL